MKRVLRLIAVSLLAIMAVLYVGWLTLPGWLPQVVDRTLQDSGWRASQWSLQRPHSHTWKLSLKLETSTASAHTEIVIDRLQLGYQLAKLLQGQLDSVAIGQLHIRISTGQAPQRKAGAGTTSSTFATGQWLDHLQAYWPVATTTIDTFDLLHPSLSGPLRGQLTLQQISAGQKLTATVDYAGIPLQLGGQIGVPIQLHAQAFQGPEAIKVDVSAQPESKGWRGSVQQNFSKVGLQRLWQALNKKQSRRVWPLWLNQLQGHWSADWQGFLPLPFDKHLVQLDGVQRLSVSGQWRGVDYHTRLQSDIQIANGGVLATLQPFDIKLKIKSPLARGELARQLIPLEWQLLLDQPWQASASWSESPSPQLASPTKLHLPPLNLRLFSQQKGLKNSAAISLSPLLENQARPGLPSGLIVGLSTSTSAQLKGLPKQFHVKTGATISRSPANSWSLTAIEPIQIDWDRWLPANAKDFELRNGSLKLSILSVTELLNQHRVKGHLLAQLTPVKIKSAHGNQQILEPLKIESTVDYDNKLLTLGDLQVSWTDLTANGLLRYDLSSNYGHLKWQAVVPEGYRLTERYWAARPAALKLTQGELALDGNLFIGAGVAPRLNGTIQVSNVTGNWRDSLFEGIALRAQYGFDGQILRLSDSELTAALIQPGIPATAAATNFSAQLPMADPRALELTVAKGSVQVLGGAASLQAPFTVKPLLPDTTFTIDLKGISLAQLLALEKQNVSGSGTLDGQLPVIWNERTLRIDQGQLAARQPGGWIRLRKTAAVERLSAQNPELKIALTALENYHFRKLSSDVNYSSQSGELQLNAKLKGANPDYNSGKTVSFNLGISENVTALMRSLRLTDDMERRLSEKYSAE